MQEKKGSKSWVYGLSIFGILCLGIILLALWSELSLDRYLNCVNYAQTLDIGEDCTEVYIRKTSLQRLVFHHTWEATLINELLVSQGLFHETGYERSYRPDCTHDGQHLCVSNNEETISLDLSPWNCDIGKCKWAFALERVYLEDGEPQIWLLKYMQQVETPDGVLYTYTPRGIPELSSPNTYSDRSLKERLLAHAPKVPSSQVLRIYP